MTGKDNRRKLIINGREFGSVRTAAIEFGVKPVTVYQRLSKGWTPEQAVGLEPRPSHLPAASNNKRKIVIQGRKFDSIQSAATAFGLSRNTIDYRLVQGWSPEQAVGLEPRPNHGGKTAGITVKVQDHEFKSIREAAKYFGRSYDHVLARLKEGFTIEQALGLVLLSDSFKTKNPELAKQWHPTKNAPLTPDKITFGSSKKVWWLCSNGHEWKAGISNRMKGRGCPYCAGHKPTADRNFATEYPELAKEWNWGKNSHKKPVDFTPRSSSKLWWKCKKGHEWQATICNRTRDVKKKSECPVCSNRVLGEDNSLAQIRPDIAEDWHPHKNAPLTPNDVVAGGIQKVWWICKHGHEWETKIGIRVNNGTGCPKCCLQTSRIEIAVYTELDALFDDVSWREKIADYECDIFLHDYRIGVEIDGVYWHSRRPNQESAKSKVFESEGIQLFRLREDGLSPLSERDIVFKYHQDEFLVISKLINSLLKHAKLPDTHIAKLRDYVKGPGLINEKLYRKLVANLPAPPPGQSLADKQPEIAAQWAYDLNAPLLPEHFWPQANKKVWWRCSKGHTWKTTMNSRTQLGPNCPKCQRPFFKVKDERNLAKLYPSIASEWHPERNGDIRPEDVRPNSNRKFWWQCSKGHDWRAKVNHRASGSGCPYCSGRYATKENNLAIKYPELLEEWDHKKNIGLNPSEFTPHSGKKVWWRCRKGHNWQTTIYNRTTNKSGCPACAHEHARKYSIEDIQCYAKERGGKCLSKKYTHLGMKLKFRCKEGHIWERRADKFLKSNKWCPVCAKGDNLQLRFWS